MNRLPRLPPLLALYLFFGWFSIFPQALFFGFDITGWTGLRDALLYTTTWLLVPALVPTVALSRVLILLGSVMGFCALTKLGNFMVFGQEISQSVFVATMETNPSEATEFFQHFVKWWMLVLGTLYLLPAIWFFHHASRLTLATKLRLILAGMTLILLVSPFLTKGFSEKGYKRFKQRFETVEPWGMLQNFTQYRTHLAESTKMAANMEQVANEASVTMNDATHEQTYVLVLGESTARQRLSLYGYSRDTNPELGAIKQELLLYQDVSAVIPYTIESLSSTLSFTDPEKLESVFHEMNVITLMKKAGFKTFWITNQQTISQRNTLLTALAELTDEQVFLNNNRRQSAASYDEVVVEPFRTALGDIAPRKLIIVHLIGAHFAYEYRYPESYNHFKDSQVPTQIPLSNEDVTIYNQYDNAVRYNDFVVRQLIETYRTADPYGFLLYFADHGEEVFDIIHMNGRSMSRPTRNMYDVPFMLWPAPRWAARHDIQTLQTTTNRPYSLHHFLHSWCDIVDLDYKKCESSKSLFSPDFKSLPRTVGISSDRHPYEQIPGIHQR